MGVFSNYYINETELRIAISLCRFNMKFLFATALLSMAVLASTKLCQDKRRGCPRWKHLCKISNFVMSNCRKTCDKNCGDGEAGGGSGSCGKRPNTRIVGGTEAKPGDWPWQAQLSSWKGGSPFCGGSLVAPQWVVSASHCGGRAYIHVRLGAHKRYGSIGNEQDFRAIKIIKHPNYKKPFGMSNDIMLLKLDKPAKFDRFVHPVCLPTSVSEVLPGKKCWITGFGRLSSGGSSPYVLMQASVPVVSQEKCKKAYYNRIHDSMICAGLDEGGIDSCQGDSGGPMVCESGGRYYLHGATSWGWGCAAPGKYGVYARVKYSGIMSWIQETMNYN